MSFANVNELRLATGGAQMRTAQWHPLLPKVTASGNADRLFVDWSFLFRTEAFPDLAHASVMASVYGFDNATASERLQFSLLDEEGQAGPLVDDAVRTVEGGATPSLAVAGSNGVTWLDVVPVDNEEGDSSEGPHAVIRIYKITKDRNRGYGQRFGSSLSTGNDGAWFSRGMFQTDAADVGIGGLRFRTAQAQRLPSSMQVSTYWRYWT